MVQSTNRFPRVKTGMEQLARKRQELLRTNPYSPQVDDRFVFGGRRYEPLEIIERLTEFLTPDRRNRIEAVLAERTYGVATVVEGLVNVGNVSAVMRSAEAMGFQAFHVITGGEAFKNSKRTSQGAEKWLDVFHWETPADCVAHLRGEGYRIVATHLDETSLGIDEIDFTQKTALIFGNENEGVSPEMVDLSDQRCIIPMSGFVQSFNISVAAAVAMYHARQDRLRRQDMHGDLSENDRNVLRAVYYLRSVKHAGLILEEVAS